MKLPRKTLEKELLSRGYGYICAVDEVGMGCLAGPVVVCAVGITNHFYKKYHKKLVGVRDSKLLSAEQREKFAAELMKEKDLAYSISQCSPKIIDKLNIYQAARQAMRRAVKKITNFPALPAGRQFLISNEFSNNQFSKPETRTIVLVDGKTKIKDLNIEQMAIVGGDRKVFAIACASIIAKVFRDKLMVQYAKKYPGYGFEKHKGYGTARHRARLVLMGPCAIHRKSFAPVAKLL